MRTLLKIFIGGTILSLFSIIVPDTFNVFIYETANSLFGALWIFGSFLNIPDFIDKIQMFLTAQVIFVTIVVIDYFTDFVKRD